MSEGFGLGNVFQCLNDSITSSDLLSLNLGRFKDNWDISVRDIKDVVSFDDGSRLYVKSVVRCGSQTIAISSIGTEAVESRLSNISTDFAIVVS